MQKAIRNNLVKNVEIYEEIYDCCHSYDKRGIQTKIKNYNFGLKVFLIMYFFMSFSKGNMTLR